MYQIYFDGEKGLPVTAQGPNNLVNKSIISPQTNPMKSKTEI